MIKRVEYDHTKRWWDTLSVLLVMVCLFIATLRLQATRWTGSLGVTQNVAFFGIILGLALGQSIFKARVSLFFAFAYGLFIIPWQLGLSMEAEVVNWVEKLTSMRGRLEVTIGELVIREAVTDNILFILLMSLLFWAISVNMGYIVTRQAHPWKTVLPAGFTIFVIHTFDPLVNNRSWFLAVYLFFAMLLVARLVYLHNRHIWKISHVHTPIDMGFDFSRIAIIVSLLLVLLAWNMPVLADSFEPASKAWVAVTRPWQSLKDQFSFAFASLRASVGVVTNMFGESMILGRGAALGDRVVLEAEVPEISLNGARFYWRGRIYDTYSNGGWDNSFTEKLPLTSDSFNMHITGEELRQEVSLTIRVYDAISLLYAASQPLWVSRPSTAAVINNPDGTVDLGSLLVNEYIHPGEQYETRSSLSSVSITDLREAGTDYPEWVIDHYLQLPDDITPRTYELAQRLAVGYETPYDIAESVTNYLRTNIQYNTVVPEIPSGQEHIDWFLFEIKEGFCNYYATAEVILLRSMGIPSRLAVGYAQGERLIQTVPDKRPGPVDKPPILIDGHPATYIVRQRDAHAWPEVYFPNIGWVEFEPTSSQEVLIRPSGAEIPATEVEEDLHPREKYSTGRIEELLEGLDTPAGTTEQGQPWTPKMVFLMSLLIVTSCVIVLIIWRVKRGFRIIPYIEQLASEVPVRLEKGLIRFGIRPPPFLSRWAYYARLPSLSRSYMQVNYALGRLGEPPEAYHTPAERVRKLTEILPVAEKPAYLVLGEYQTAVYSNHAADVASAQLAGGEIRKLSFQAILHRWLARFQELSTGKSPE